MSARIIQGDCVDAMAAMPATSVDAIVTDPPYLLSFMGRDWDHAPSPAEGQAMHERWAREALRVLKPGGHLLAFGGTRTYHRLACAIEDAGFEIRDTIAWLYGSGFPKSLNAGKAMDTLRWRHPGDFRLREAAAWAGHGSALKPAHEPIVVARKPLIDTVAANVLAHGTGALNVDGCRIEHHGDIEYHATPSRSGLGRNGIYSESTREQGANSDTRYHGTGRWPANVCLDEQAAALLDAQTEGAVHGAGTARSAGNGTHSGVRTEGWGNMGAAAMRFGDTGGASRFLYVAKASSAERGAGLKPCQCSKIQGWENEGQQEATQAGTGTSSAAKAGSSTVDADPATSHGSLLTSSSDVCADCGEVIEGAVRNTHPLEPTVKPIALMRWLVRLVTPPGGTVLDPFAGSGTTGIAAVLEGLDFLGIEREAEYVAIAEARIAWWAEHPDGMTLVKRLEAEVERAAVMASGQTSIFDTLGES